MMTLRQKTLMAIATTLIGLNAILYTVSSKVLIGNSTVAEEHETKRTVETALNIFAYNRREFQSKWTDWSQWDDAYRFVQTRDRTFVASNLVDTFFVGLSVNLVVFADTSGQIVYATSFDSKANRRVPIPTSIEKHLAIGKLFFGQGSDTKQSLTGILALPEGLMLVSSQPILTSQAKGPIKGTMVVGRYLTDERIANLTNIVGLSVAVKRSDDVHLPADFKIALDNLSDAQSAFVRPLSEQKIAGYTLLKDIYGKPIAVLRSDNARVIYEKSQNALSYFTIVMLLVGIVFIGVTLVLLEKLVLLRLAFLSDEVTSIGMTGDLSARVSMAGDDELSRLTASVNEMLATLEYNEKKERQIQIALKQAKEEAEAAQAKSEELLLNILPESIAKRLKLDTTAIAEHFEQVTILFADIVGFTPLSTRLPPIELVNSLNQIFSTFDRLAEKHGLEKIKTIGDAYMAACGLPLPRPDHAEAVAEMALDMQDAIRQFKTSKGESFQIRVGINSGHVVAGVIGIKKFIYDLWGDTVNLASRMESQGIPGGIQVTEATYGRLKDKYVFEEREKITVKGKGEMTTYWLLDRLPTNRV